MSYKIQPDSFLLSEWDKHTNGANAHHMGQTRNCYTAYCYEGNAERVEFWAQRMRAELAKEKLKAVQS